MTALRDTACKRARAGYIAKAAEREREMVAWDRFVSDYVGAVDADPADARRRYLAQANG